jgi:hypothetical protein
MQRVKLFAPWPRAVVLALGITSGCDTAPSPASAATEPPAQADVQADAVAGGGDPADALASDVTADTVVDTATQGAPVAIAGEAWADNWFALSANGKWVAEDAVPITTEKSFNSEAFSFQASYPLTLAVVLKDFKQDDSGLEYIGTPKQQIGDGGFKMQLRDAQTGKALAWTDATWRCKAIHRAPLDATCVDDPEPLQTCGFVSEPEPSGWRDAGFDDSAWPMATVHPAAAVGPKDGYLQVQWLPAAQFIWSADLRMDNTVLCRLRVDGPLP